MVGSKSNDGWCPRKENKDTVTPKAGMLNEAGNRCWHDAASE